MSVSTVPVFTLKPSTAAASGRLLYVPGGSISHPLLQLSFSSSRSIKLNLSVSRLAVKPIPSRFSPSAAHALNWVEEEGEDALVDEQSGNEEDESEDDFENETRDHDEPVAQRSEWEIDDDVDDDEEEEEDDEFTEDSSLSYVDEDNEGAEAEMSEWESEEEDDDEDEDGHGEEGEVTEDDEGFEAELSELESEDEDIDAELSELESEDEDIDAELSELESNDDDDDEEEEGNGEREEIEGGMSDEIHSTGSDEVERIPSAEVSEYEPIRDPSLDSDMPLREHLEEAKLFVGNLTFNVDSRMLAERFGDAGTVEIAEVIYNWETNQSRGFAFVTMSSIDEADKAVQMLHHREIDGRMMVVHKAVARGSRPARIQASFGFKIYCGNVSYNVDDALLNQIFSRHGEVLNAMVVCDKDTGRSRGFAFVTMSTLTDQENAIAALDGHLLDGRKIRVAKAEDRARFGTMQTRYGFARSAYGRESQ